MTDLLVKWFVKDNEQIENAAVRTRYGILASIVGVICNVILFVVKITIGTIIQSISVTADAFNNLSDAASGVIGFAGVKIASRPADKEHPFGHGRYEYIAALAVAFLVLQVGLNCFQSAFSKVLHPEAVKFRLGLVIALIISILIKIWLGCFNRRLGERINSNVMKATATDAFGDVLITSATILSLFINKYIGLMVDGYMGIIVSVLVLLAGFNIAKDTLEPLIGEAATVETYELITNKVESYDGIVGSHDLIVHNYGPSHTMATIHAEIPNSMGLSEAHELIDVIEQDVYQELGIFLVIHMDPLAVNDNTVVKLKADTQEIIKMLDSKASLHDFRMVEGECHKKILFDLVVPHNYSVKQERELVEKIKEQVEQLDDRYECMITLEHSYVSGKNS